MIQLKTGKTIFITFSSTYTRWWFYSFCPCWPFHSFFFCFYLFFPLLSFFLSFFFLSFSKSNRFYRDLFCKIVANRCHIFLITNVTSFTSNNQISNSNETLPSFYSTLKTKKNKKKEAYLFLCLIFWTLSFVAVFTSPYNPISFVNILFVFKLKQSLEIVVNSDIHGKCLI